MNTPIHVPDVGSSLQMFFARDGYWASAVFVTLPEKGFRFLSKFYGPGGFDENGNHGEITHDVWLWDRAGEHRKGVRRKREETRT